MAFIKECNCCHEIKKHAVHNSTTCNDCLAIGLKWCSSCKTVKPIEDFYKSGNTISSLCKECQSKHSVQSRVNTHYYDRPDVKERLKEYYDRPDVKERMRVQSVEYQRRQYATEEGRQKEIMKRHNRRTKIQGTVTLAEWKETLEYFDNACAYCGSAGKITQDHIVPVSGGGLNTKYNLVPACLSCNSSKNNRPLVQWYMKQPFATEERLQKVLDFMKKGEEANAV